MDHILPQCIALLGPGRVFVDEKMDNHSSFKSGGTASLFLLVDTISELQSAIHICQENTTAYKVIGSGTLAIFSDEGYTGVIIKNNSRRFEVMTMVGKIRQQQIAVDTALLYAEAGANMNQVVRYAIEQGLSGLEYQLGLPGTVGGAIYSNAQFVTKQKYIGDVVKSARILTPDGHVVEVDASYFAFGFDGSCLQKSNDVVLSVIFELTPTNKSVLWERGMQASTARSLDQPTEKSYTYRNMQVISSREALITQPDISEILTTAEATTLQLGDVKLSEKRYNYVINTGGATSKNFCEFINELKKKIKTKTGSEIEVRLHTIGKEV